MTTYAIKAPDGHTYQIEGPSGASDEQVRAEVLKQHPKAGSPSLMDRIGQGVDDAVSGAGDFLKNNGRTLATAGGGIVGGIVAAPEAALAGIPTAGLGALATEAGGVGLGAGIGGQVYDLASRLLTKSKPLAMADQLKTVGSDVLMNAASVPAGVVAGKALSTLGVAGVKATGRGLAAALGRTTGAGSAAIRQAATAGRTGGPAAANFRANLTGAVPSTDVLNAVDSKLSSAYKARNSEYRTSMEPLQNNTTNIDLAPIDKAIADQRSTAYGSQGDVKNEAAAKVLKAVNEKVATWRSHNLNSPADLDELKQSIGEIRSNEKPGTPAFRAADEVYSAISETISDAAPEYAGIMSRYSGASSELNDIRSTLSLNTRASTATKMGKLLSAMKGAPGVGATRAEVLEGLAGPNDTAIAPALAGQALSPTVRGGLGGAALGLGELGAGVAYEGLHDPRILGSALAAGLTTSPRIVGEGAYFTGKATRYAQALAAKLSAMGYSPQRAAILANQVAASQNKEPN